MPLSPQILVSVMIQPDSFDGLFFQKLLIMIHFRSSYSSWLMWCFANWGIAILMCCFARRYCKSIQASMLTTWCTHSVSVLWWLGYIDTIIINFSVSICTPSFSDHITLHHTATKEFIHTPSLKYPWCVVLFTSLSQFPVILTVQCHPLIILRC